MSDDIRIGTYGWWDRIYIKHGNKMWSVDSISCWQRNMRIVKTDPAKLNPVKNWAGMGIAVYGRTFTADKLTSVGRDELTQRYQSVLQALGMGRVKDGFLSSARGSNPIISNGKQIAYRFSAGEDKASIARISKSPKYLWGLDPCLISSSGEIVIPAEQIIETIVANKGILFDPLAWKKAKDREEEFVYLKWGSDKPQMGILYKSASSV